MVLIFMFVWTLNITKCR